LGKEWRQKCGLPPLVKGKREINDWVLHGRGLTNEYDVRIKPKRVNPASIPSRTIRIPGNISWHLKLLESVDSADYCITRDNAILRGGITLSKFLRQATKRTAPSTDGQVEFSSLLQSKGTIAVYMTDYPDIVKHYRAPKADVTVAAHGNSAFELMVLLETNEVSYETIVHPDSESFEKTTDLAISAITGSYESTNDSNRATIAYIGADTIRTPELRSMFLNAVQATSSPKHAAECLKWALDLEQTQREEA
jgi:hypothetical protein